MIMKKTIPLFFALQDDFAVEIAESGSETISVIVGFSFLSNFKEIENFWNCDLAKMAIFS